MKLSNKIYAYSYRIFYYVAFLIIGYISYLLVKNTSIINENDGEIKWSLLSSTVIPCIFIMIHFRNSLITKSTNALSFIAAIYIILSISYITALMPDNDSIKYISFLNPFIIIYLSILNFSTKLKDNAQKKELLLTTIIDAALIILITINVIDYEFNVIKVKYIFYANIVLIWFQLIAMITNSVINKHVFDVRKISNKWFYLIQGNKITWLAPALTSLTIFTNISIIIPGIEFGSSIIFIIWISVFTSLFIILIIISLTTKIAQTIILAFINIIIAISIFSFLITSDYDSLYISIKNMTVLFFFLFGISLVIALTVKRYRVKSSIILSIMGACNVAYYITAFETLTWFALTDRQSLLLLNSPSYDVIIILIVSIPPLINSAVLIFKSVKGY